MCVLFYGAFGPPRLRRGGPAQAGCWKPADHRRMRLCQQSRLDMRACHPASKAGDRVDQQGFPRPIVGLSSTTERSSQIRRGSATKTLQPGHFSPVTSRKGRLRRLRSREFEDELQTPLSTQNDVAFDRRFGEKTYNEEIHSDRCLSIYLFLLPKKRNTVNLVASSVLTWRIARFCNCRVSARGKSRISPTMACN
ncbi:hypothetical protein CP98_04414 [Sphingobium yanoikuyae]|uniref:Uncharacterized protein n=1 Tax=Sphingobium yanoikuyae TaxID=13690 RepID=A0A084ECL1_SPHYA|nr:hypothetical protein CP98_04414 [Sphingobium yanoikuyae]